MSQRTLTCPQCSGPLSPGKFARTTVCPYCGSTVALDGRRAVSAARFRAAFEAWNAPASHGHSRWVTIGDSHWVPGSQIARGEISDVYVARRARWPTERVLLKILREPAAQARFDREWEVLTALQRGAARGAASFLRRLPRPVVRGRIDAGARTGAAATAFGWADGFRHTFEAVRRAYPAGVEPRAAVWIWRRILEVLSFLHAAGFVHGAVVPPHLLVEDGEHGVRLVSYGCAGAPGDRLAAVAPGCEAAYPGWLLSSRELSTAADVAMSARAVIFMLGGDPATGEVPKAVPAALASLVAEVGAGKPGRGGELDAWPLRERLGALAGQLFGRPAFCPIVLPESSPPPAPSAPVESA